ncbi:hypothetical protein ACFL15_01120 [Patescibacteria group bacterium]
MEKKVKDIFSSNVIIIFSIFLFLFLLPIYSKINFHQNDDWAFSKSVESFLSRDFSSVPIKIMGKSAPLFYTQGIIGYIFSLAFGLSSLPILTLLISIGCFYLLNRILLDFFNKKLWEALLISFFFFVNPIFIYSSIGFMTENYFLFSALLSMYFFERYKKDESWKNLLLINLGIVLAFFVRQIALVISVGLFVELFKKKNWKHISVHCFLNLLLFIFYYFYYYTSSSYSYSGFNLMKFKQWDYFRSLFISFFIYISAFLFPFLILRFTKLLKSLNKYQRILIFILYFLLVVLFKENFIPDALFKGEFPYLGNTFMRKGFYADGVHGTKYQFVGVYDLYSYWNLAAFYLSPIFLVLFLFKIKDFIGFYGISILTYIAFMMFLPVVYDRYLGFLLLLVLLFFLSKLSIDKLYKKLFIGAFLIFQLIISYQFSMDFILGRRYIWSKSERLSRDGVNSSNIMSTFAFRKIYSRGDDFDYLFSYDSPEILRDDVCCKNLIETYEVKYPCNFFISPKIYLYER